MTTEGFGSRWIEYALIVVGVLVLSYCAFVWADSRVFQAYENWLLDRMFHRKSPPVGGEAHPGKPSSHAVLGRLEIPRLHLSTIVLEGDDEGALRLGAGHLPGTALPGQPGPGNVVIEGGTLFRTLQQIARRDVITLATPSGMVRYSVESTEVVKPTKTSVLAPTLDPILTLITSRPFGVVGPAPDRFIVRARRIE